MDDIFDVDKEFGGNVFNALAAANRSVVAGAPAAVVLLGSLRLRYDLNQTLIIPGNVSVIGMGNTILHFNLSVPPVVCDVEHCDCYQDSVPCSSAISSPPFIGAVSASGSDWTLRNVTIVVSQAPSPVFYVPAPAIWVHPGASRFSVTGVTVLLQQANMSNALRVESATDFEIGNNTLVQAGSCEDAASEHHPSHTRYATVTTMWLTHVANGWVHHNTVLWKCAGTCMDSGVRMIIEDNVLRCDSYNGAALCAGGNGIATFSGPNPISKFWSYARNHHARIPDMRPNRSWYIHESFTSDGGAGWGAGGVVSFDGTLVTLAVNVTNASAVPPGSTILVVDGPGLGQWRRIVATSGTRQIVLDEPFDMHVNKSSIVSITFPIGPGLRP